MTILKLYFFYLKIMNLYEIKIYILAENYKSASKYFLDKPGLAKFNISKIDLSNFKSDEKGRNEIGFKIKQ